MKGEMTKRNFVLWAWIVLLLCVATYEGHTQGDAAALARKQLLACGLQQVTIEGNDDELVIAYTYGGQMRGKLALALVAIATQDIASRYSKVTVIARQNGHQLLKLTTDPKGLAATAQANAGTAGMEQARLLLQQAEGSALASPSPASTPTNNQGRGAEAAAPCPAPPAGSANELAQSLVQAGFENVAVRVLAPAEVVVEYENRTYRSQAEGLGTVARIAGQLLAAGTPLTIIAKRDDVPVVIVSTKAGAVEQLGPGTEGPSVVQVRRQAPQGKVVESSSLGSSFGRCDVSLRPVLKYEIGNELRPFMTDWFIAPQLTSTIAPGWRVSVQGMLQVDNPGASIDRLLLTRTGRAWNNRVLWTGSAGKFDDRLQGVFGEVQLELGEGRAGLRLASLGRDDWGFNIPMWLGYYEREFGKLGVTVRGTVGRFADYNKLTGLVELDRRFGESYLGTAVTIGSPVREGIVHLTVPLGPRRVGDPSSLRVRPANYWGIDYFTHKGAPGTEMLRGDHDLRSFRDELTGPYLAANPGRLAGVRCSMPQQSWICGPSHEGISGLIRIPTADVIPDGSYRAGVSYIDANHMRTPHTGKSEMIPFFINIGLLPHLEIGGRLTIFPDLTEFDWNYDMDRSLFIHYQLWRQKGSRPAVAIGAQDVKFGDDSSMVGRAQYAVATQQFKNWRAHLGVGSDRMSGVFGGVEVRCSPRLALMGEYDTDWFNFGIRTALDKHWRLDLTLTDMDSIGGALSYSAMLP